MNLESLRQMISIFLYLSKKLTKRGAHKRSYRIRSNLQTE